MNNETVILEFLEASDDNYLEVVDGSTGKVLEKKINIDDVLANYTSVKDWLKSFNDNGIDTLQLTKLRKSGAVNRRITPVIIADFNIKKQIEPNNMSMQNNNNNDMFGMNGNNPFGMNGAQILSAVSKEMDYARLETAFEREKNKNIALESLLSEASKKLSEVELGLATANRKSELDIQEIQNSQKGILDSQIAAKLVDNIPLILEAMKTKVPSQAIGMGQPANDTSLSEQKNQFITAIKAKEVTDEMLTALYFTIQGMITNPDFKDALNQFLKSFNLVKPSA